MSTAPSIPDRYARLVLAFERSIGSLRKLFESMRVSLAADGGFIGHEDLEGNIRLVLSRGKYFHLSSGAGFAGQVFHSAEASICDLESPVVERPTSGVTAEMGAPLASDGQTIGVVVLDRHSGRSFTRWDLAHLEIYAREISGLVSSSKAWEQPATSDVASLLANGKLALEAERYESAERLLCGALEVDQQNVAALHLLGETYLHTRRYAAATKTFERVLVLEPEMTRAKQHLAALAAMRTD